MKAAFDSVRVSAPRHHALGCLLLLVAASGCQSNAPAPQGEPGAPASAAQPAIATPASAAQPKPGYQRYGAALTLTDAVPLSKVLNTPAEYANRPVLVEAKVRRACSKKGCWMEIAEGDDPKSPGCRVTFKDYAFFVPTSSAGADARVQGQVLIQTVQKKFVDHLEAEGAQFARKNPDGSAEEVRFEASGVELRL